MLVWVNEKAIFCSDFSRVVFDRGAYYELEKPFFAVISLVCVLAHTTTPTRNKHNRGAASAVIEVTV